MKWQAHVLTLFPDMFPGPLGVSLAGKALQAGVWDLCVHNIRDYSNDKHKTVDDTPFGGGPGMVLRADVIHAALESVSQQCNTTPRFIYMTPRGRPLKQATLQRLSQENTSLVILCGHYEGVDQRVLEAWPFEEISIGDFVLSGGEIAATVLLDGVVRLLPGVIGDSASLQEESFTDGLLEYPHYTRPQEWQARKVPDVLLCGHHQKIAQWRRQQAESITRERRPDLWALYTKAETQQSLPISLINEG